MVNFLVFLSVQSFRVNCYVKRDLYYFISVGENVFTIETDKWKMLFELMDNSKPIRLGQKREHNRPHSRYAIAVKSIEKPYFPTRQLKPESDGIRLLSALSVKFPQFSLQMQIYSTHS